MKKSWVCDVNHLTGTGADSRSQSHAVGGAPIKPYLTEAPALIAVMRQLHDGHWSRVNN